MYGTRLFNKHGGFDSSVCYLCAIIQFHRLEYDVGTRYPVSTEMKKPTPKFAVNPRFDLVPS